MDKVIRLSEKFSHENATPTTADTFAKQFHQVMEEVEPRTA